MLIYNAQSWYGDFEVLRYIGAVALVRQTGY